jgi:4,5-DOPA dioxygenase extradiol
MDTGTALPTLFVSHGSPMHALEPGAVGETWRALAGRGTRPRAILMISAHWETRLPMLGGAEKPETVHDFHGFPAALYRLRYPAPGSPALAARAQALLKEAGFAAGIDGSHGLDHGAWSPLLHMYPAADIPVVQLSVQPELGMRHHLAIGRALAPLALEGVLVVGSGSMTHNLRDWMMLRAAAQAAPAPYVLEFRDWVRARLEAGDREGLADYREHAPHGERAHPTEEHFLPLIAAAGAAGVGARAECVLDLVENAVLAMDTWRFTR